MVIVKSVKHEIKSKVIIEANGQAWPLMFLFRRVHFRDPSSRKCSVAHGKNRAAKKPKVADAEKDDPPCLYCGELYSKSRKELQQWIRCEGRCEKWAYTLCTGTEDKRIVREICLSD